jgi:hypothetical protein
MSEFSIPGLLPGVVDSYDQEARTCRVRIPGITDGSTALPVAVFSNPIGDRADDVDTKRQTEIRILPGDDVWLMFEAGDPRFPIIMGYRTKRAGNPVDWRRWRHNNIEITADGDMVLNANRLVLNVAADMETHVGGSHKTDVGSAMESTAGTSKHSSTTHLLTAQTTIAGAIATQAGPGGQGASLQGPIAIVGGTVTHDGKNIGKTHTHTGVTAGGSNTGAPT